MTRQHFKTVLQIAVVSIFLFLSKSVYSQQKWLKAGNAREQYESFIDSNNQHEGRNVITLKSIDTGIVGFGCLTQHIKPTKYLGKRVRMTGYLRSKDVTDWAGFWFRVDQADSTQYLSFDNMEDRPIKGTTDWKKYEIVLDVPTKASNMVFGALMSKTGQIWIDKVFFEIVDNSVPTTCSCASLNDEDAALISKEKEKWEALKKGKLNMHNNWFGEDFVSIGYMPDGSVYRTEKKNLAKPTNRREQNKLPPAIFLLSNFEVVTASPDVKVITYRAEGPVNLYATTTWAKRNGEWKSIFYQATKFQ